MTCSHMSYFFISKQLLWELFFRISNSKSFYKMYVLQGGVALTIELKYDTGYFLVVAGLSNNNISPSTANVYTVITAAETRKSDVSIVCSSTSDVNISIEGNKLTLSSNTWKKIFIK